MAGNRPPDQPTGAELRTEVEALLDELDALMVGHSSRALLGALGEAYARVVALSVARPDDLERVLRVVTNQVRGCWLERRGGSGLVS